MDVSGYVSCVQLTGSPNSIFLGSLVCIIDLNTLNCYPLCPTLIRGRAETLSSIGVQPNGLTPWYVPFRQSLALNWKPQYGFTADKLCSICTHDFDR